MDAQCKKIGADRCMVVYYEQLVLHPKRSSLHPKSHPIQNQMVDDNPGVPQLALGGRCLAPRATDQQAGRGESLQYFDSRLKIFKGEGFYGGAVQRPDHQAHQPRRLDHMGGHLSRGK